MPPPSLAVPPPQLVQQPPPAVSLPPPGIHIPAHQGPLVPQQQVIYFYVNLNCSTQFFIAKFQMAFNPAAVKFTTF